MVKKALLLSFIFGLFNGCSSEDSGARPSKDRADNPGALVNRLGFKPKKYVEIILDASGSMGAEIEGEIKINTAKQMLALVTQSLQEEQAAVSLTAFGHRKSWSCRDIEHIFDNEYKSPEEIMSRVNPIFPAVRGKTPLAASLALAYERLKNIKGPKGIFLITDGAETCKGDPCKVAKILNKELDVQIYVLTYNPSSIEEFKTLSCLGENELVKKPDEFLGKLAALKAQFDQDYERKLEGLETVQTLKVRGPQQDAWATATLSTDENKRYRFLGIVGTSLPVGVFDVEVHYDPPVFFKGVELKEKEKKVLTVKGEGALVLELDFPGVELEAVNLLDSSKYRVMAGEEAQVPIGKYNVYGMTTSGLAFQWLNQVVTPAARVELQLPNWALLEIQTRDNLTFDLFRYYDPNKSQTASRASFNKDISKVKQFKDSVGFFTTNAPHVVEPGEYTVVLSNGTKIDKLVVERGQKFLEAVR